MKTLQILLIIASLSFTASCQKCKVCACKSSNGTVTEQHFCSSGFTVNQAIKDWEEGQKDRCPNVQCRVVK